MSQRLSTRVALPLLLLTSCAARPPSQASLARVAAIVTASSEGACLTRVHIDEVGENEYAIDGCGYLGVYHCTEPNSLFRARQRLAGDLDTRARCDELGDGAAVYAHAVGSWGEVTESPPGSREGGEPALPASPEPPSSAEVSLRVRALLDRQATSILACSGTDTLAIRVRWTAACLLDIDARHDDRDVNGCVSALLPDRLEGCGEADQLLHVVRAPE